MTGSTSLTIGVEMKTLEAVRAAAKTEFSNTPMPSATEEAWRRTDAGLWGFASLAAAGAKPAVYEFTLPPELAAKGVFFMDLETAARRHPEKVLEAMTAGIEPEYLKWELANRAYGNGVFLWVPQGVKSDAPLHLMVRHPEAARTFPRVVVRLEEDAEITLVEEHLSEDSGTSSAISQLQLGRGARLRYSYIQNLGPRAVHFWHQRVRLAKDADLQHAALTLGGRVAKTQTDVALAETGAASRLYGIIFGSGSQHFDPHTSQRHLAPKTSSDLLFRSVLKDKARSIYTGLIRIEKEGVDTEAYQANHNLLLSSTARADTTPVLEILTDAVRCKHGATAGPLPADELFYLGCRGIAENEAKRLLVMGFFEPIFSRLPEPVRIGLAARTEARLEGI